MLRSNFNRFSPLPDDGHTYFVETVTDCIESDDIAEWACNSELAEKWMDKLFYKLGIAECDKAARIIERAYLLYLAD